MSFAVPSQRGFQQAQSDIPTIPTHHNQQPTRMNIQPSQQYDQYHSSHNPFPASPLSAPPLQNGAQTAFPHDQTSQQLPKVGETRCYWVLLTADLHFIYMDPVLSHHLEEQADSLVGKSLLSFVHPDEQASAKHDLGSVLESRTLHGSVTRVRFSRLSRVRRELGYQGPGPSWIDADKIAFDRNYMAVDIVINWAAEGLVLCFLHAVVDLSPQDNDEMEKTPWTNWCNTPSMGMDQIQLLYQRLLMCIPHGSLSRVFQILSNHDGRPLLLSWPPDDENRSGPTGRDFAKLVEDVQIGTGPQSGNDAKTSCTRRYKAEQNMSGGMGQVESIFIPHGTIIFACHKVNAPARGSGSGNSTMHQIPYNGPNYGPPPGAHYYEQGGSTYVLPPLPNSPAYGNYVGQHPSHSNYSPQHWSQGGAESPTGGQQPYSPWSAQSPTHAVPSLPSSVSHLRSGPYPPHQQAGWAPSGGPNSGYIGSEGGGQPGFSRSISPQFGGYSEDGGPVPSTPDTVPPPRRRVSPGASRDQYGPGGRNVGNRPVGVLRCSSCKATQSPEWRKGPSGKKELCNACGLRYARSRAKKDGHALNTQRRRKEKGLSSKPGSATPPASIGMRRNYDEASLMSNSSAGSGSGNEVYSGHPSLDGLTPSPSPPAGGMSFVHYNHTHPHGGHSPHPHGDSRHGFPAGSSSFYTSMPSPLSSSPALTAPSQHGDHHHQPPSGYPGRLSSPLLSPSLTTTMPPASYERERDRDRQLPEARSSAMRSE